MKAGRFSCVALLCLAACLLAAEGQPANGSLTLQGEAGVLVSVAYDCAPGGACPTEWTGVTSADGGVTFADCPPRVYTLSFARPGFFPQARQVKLEPGQNLILKVPALKPAPAAAATDKGTDKGTNKGQAAGPVSTIMEEEFIRSKSAIDGAMKIMNIDLTVSLRDKDGNGMNDIYGEYTGRSVSDFRYVYVRSAFTGAAISVPIANRVDRVYLLFNGTERYATMKDLLACNQIRSSKEQAACWDEAWKKVE